MCGILGLSVELGSEMIRSPELELEIGERFDIEYRESALAKNIDKGIS